MINRRLTKFLAFGVNSIRRSSLKSTTLSESKPEGHVDITALQQAALANQRSRIHLYRKQEFIELEDKYFWNKDPSSKSARRSLRNDHGTQVSNDFQYANISAVACGCEFSVFVCRTGRVYGIGLNTDGQIGQNSFYNLAPVDFTDTVKDLGSQIVSASCGRSHTLLLTKEGTVIGLGDNAYGQCGKKSKDRTHVYSLKVEGRSVVQVCCGLDHSILVCDDGSVWACGLTCDGQTAQDTSDRFHSDLRKVAGVIDGVKIRKVSCQGDTVLALSESGEVYGWGNNEYSQLLVDPSIPQLTSPHRIEMPAVVQNQITDVCAGGTFCLALTDDGHIYTWGYGMLGPCSEVQYIPVPTLVPPELLGVHSKVDIINSGLHHSVALTTSGNLYMWGRCCTDNKLYPFKMLPGEDHILDVCCGTDHTVIVCANETPTDYAVDS